MLAKSILGRLAGSSLRLNGAAALQQLPPANAEPQALSQQVRNYKQMAQIPKGLDVDPKSPMLYHFFKSIHPHQVSFRIKKRKELRHLWELCQIYEKKMDTLASAAMLGQLLRLQKRNNPDYTPELASCVFEFCLKRLDYTIRFSHFKDIVPLLDVFARMDIVMVPSDNMLLDAPPPSSSDADAAAPHRVSEKFIYEFLSRSVRSREDLRLDSPRQVARTLWAVAKLFPGDKAMDSRVQDAVDKLGRASVRRLSDLHPGQLSAYAYAVSKLGPSPKSADAAGAVDAWDPTLAGAFTSLVGMDANQVSTLARARTLKLMDAVSREVLLRVGDALHEPFTVRNIYLLLKAYMQAQIQNPDMAQVLSEHIAGRIQEVYPNEIEVLVRASERLEGFHTPALCVAILRRAEESGLSEDAQKEIAKRLH